MTAVERLILRADAQPAIGSGHAVRMVALGEEWVQHGRAELHATDLAGWIAEEASTRGLIVNSISAEAGGEADAKAVSEASGAAAWVVVDGYQFDDGFRQLLAPTRVAVVDDHAITAPYSAELVVDQNVGASRAHYEAAASGAILLLGPRYALLRSDFRVLRPTEPKNNPAGKVLVSLGGFPSGDVLGLVEGALALLPGDVRVDVLNGRAADAPRRMADATVALVAAGTTVWELSCLGVPAVLIATNDNQLPVAEEMGSRGAGLNLGWWEALTPEGLARSILNLVRDRDQQRALATQAHALVDGLGVKRVVSALRAPRVQVRCAAEGDSRLLWKWANDATTRNASFAPDPIPWDTHVEWLARKLTDPLSHIYVASNEAGTPIAQIRFDASVDTMATAEVGIAVAPEARGQGYGVAVLLAGVERIRRTTGIQTIDAVVKTANIPSLRAFERAGFVRVGVGEFHGSSVVRFQHTEST